MWQVTAAVYVGVVCWGAATRVQAGPHSSLEPRPTPWSPRSIQAAANGFRGAGKPWLPPLCSGLSGTGGQTQARGPASSAPGKAVRSTESLSGVWFLGNSGRGQEPWTSASALWVSSRVALTSHCLSQQEGWTESPAEERARPLSWEKSRHFFPG